MGAKLTVGQVIFQVQGKEIKERVVTSVGRKYFYLDNRLTKFDVGTMQDVSNFGSRITVYLTRQEIEDNWEMGKLFGEFRVLFTKHCCPLSLSQLRGIKKIVDGGANEHNS